MIKVKVMKRFLLGLLLGVALFIFIDKFLGKNDLLGNKASLECVFPSPSLQPMQTKEFQDKYKNDKDQYISKYYRMTPGFAEGIYIEDLDGDGVEEWLGIDGPEGSGGFINYSVFTMVNGEPKELFFEGPLYQGSVKFVNKRIEETLGYPRPGDANCCPSRMMRKLYFLENGKVKLEKAEIFESGYSGLY
ncbi:hypothetical protein KKA18_03385 [Patescibacteria group bacterium]|nr:hypothetical protein [Patescibacteria group bacterium]